ncbi:type VII secretion target [Nocardia sp. NPDC058658]|uniref:type VII secretion target n=1 Tax=Nocardia sp. NPDC058658 TaxID=3346580 RepID=UPI0036472603
MADRLQADHSTIAEFGSAHAGMASTVAASAFEQGALVAAVAPVFGLIGQDFLAAFSGAAGNHLTTLGEIAAVHAGTSVTAFEAAGLYTSTDQASSGSLSQVI